MKVLFALNDENVSEEIVKKYQKDFKEIISYKNVYYFNAIIKEMQKDKSYDRIVIGEDLEPFANNNYDTIDKFLFEKLDNISDEANDNGDTDTQIILICSDRRTKTDKLLVKLFGIGIYSAIIGKDRSIEEVCRLINSPRTKKDAKQYYHVDADDVDYKAESDTDVNENEIQSILKHYKSLGKNEEKYVESFDNIATQYTDAQLRIIIKFLPMNVKAVLEEKSPRYQQLVMFGDKQYKKNNTTNIVNQDTKYQQKNVKMENHGKGSNLGIESIERRVNNPLTGKSIVIPSAVKQAKTVEFERKMKELETSSKEVKNSTQNIAELVDEPINNTESFTESSDGIVIGHEKRRGRPKKIVANEELTNSIETETPVKKGRGRPKKVVPESVNLFGMATDDDEFKDFTPETNSTPLNILPGLDDEVEASDNEFDEGNEISNYMSNNYNQENYYDKSDENQIEKRETYVSRDFSNLVTGDKKIAAFVGSTKNGTSFIVNNLAMLLSSMGINTAILDLTENKNSYYIYTKNEENLRKTAYDSIKKLKEDVADGILVNKNLSVYTSLPGEENEQNNIHEILQTLINNHSLVLLDCDFNTKQEYFEASQEIYLVQSMDILTIQPLTAFLRDLKNNGILNQEKLRVVMNKYTKIRGLNEKVLLGGMAFYNSPSMSFMTELFNKDNIKFCTIPLDVNTYIAYLEAMVSCDVSLNKYSKIFMQSLKELASMVYPLLSRQTYKPMDIRKDKRDDINQGYFSNNMNSTLEQMNKMKNGY